MNEITVKIEILSFWHIGSGSSRGGDVDEVMLKDDNKLPYLPGKTLKGLLKEGMMICAETDTDTNNITIDDVYKYFGTPSVGAPSEGNDDRGSTPGALRFNNATLSTAEANTIIKKNLANALYEKFTSTKINDAGIAIDKSLRAIEVCVPVTLYTKITVDDKGKEALKLACKFVRCLGAHRNRGLGRCKIEVLTNGGN